MEYLNLSGEILPITGEIPRPTLLRSIRNTAIKFAKETRLLTQDYLAQTVTNEQVTLVAPQGYRIFSLNWVKYRGEETFYTHQENVVTVPRIEDAHTVDIQAVLMPTRDSRECDDRIMDTWYEAITAGSIANVLSMRTEPWFDPQMAGVYAQSYQTLKDEALHKGRNDDRQGVRDMAYGGL